jgi:hypothetical protein
MPDWRRARPKWCARYGPRGQDLPQACEATGRCSWWPPATCRSRKSGSACAACSRPSASAPRAARPPTCRPAKASTGADSNPLPRRRCAISKSRLPASRRNAADAKSPCSPCSARAQRSAGCGKAASLRIETQFSAEERAYAWGQIAHAGGAAPPAGRARLVRTRPLHRRCPTNNWPGRFAPPCAPRLGRGAARDRRHAAALPAQPDWTYWQGRALAAAGRGDEARANYLKIGGQPNFYGNLADEELGRATSRFRRAPRRRVPRKWRWLRSIRASSARWH